jgi:hypothetical protein
MVDIFLMVTRYKSLDFIFILSSATVFLGYLGGTWRYLSFLLISVINFYYVISKLIILVPVPH